MSCSYNGHVPRRLSTEDMEARNLAEVPPQAQVVDMEISANVEQLGNIVNPYPCARVADMVKYLMEKLYAVDPNLPKLEVGIICGSGLGRIVDNVRIILQVNYADIPYFPKSTVHGHDGRLIFGYLNDTFVVCMKGRFHYYEGYRLCKCVVPVRVMKRLGCTHIIVTNAAGGINPDFNVGDIMLIKDHISMMGLAGNGPLVGPHEAEDGERFVSMTNAYNNELIQVAKSIGKELGIPLKEGIYVAVGGPNYETVAELRFLKMIGVDCVGMSTVHEVITARQAGLKVFALSLVTNVCALDYETTTEACHTEVMEVAESQGPTILALISEIVDYIHKHRDNTQK